MDRKSWRILSAAIRRAARVARRVYRPQRLRFSDGLIVSMFFWAVAHDRPQGWACERTHYHGVCRPRRLPAVSQFNRRMNEPRTYAILRAVHQEVGGDITATALSYLDGKPLAVGVASKDPDAARGHVMGGWARGYKLHAWMSEDRRIPLWSVTPLNVDERPTAELLIAQVGALSERSLILADQNYDTHDLHKQIDAHGGRLLVEAKGADPARRHPVTLRQMGPARRELLKVQARAPGLFRMVHRQRVNAEGILGNLCGYGGGLTTLPPWVRRLRRVRRWVGAKIILYHARLRARRADERAA